MTVLEKVLSGKWELCVGDGKAFLRTASFQATPLGAWGPTEIDRNVSDEDVAAVIAHRRTQGCIVKWEGSMTHYYTRSFGEKP